MKKRELLNRPSVLTVLRSIIPVAILPISLALFRNADFYASSGILPAAMMLGWTLCEALAAVEALPGSKLGHLSHIIRAAVCLLCTVLLLIGGTQPGFLRAAGLLFALTLAVGRVFSILEKRSVKSTILNILAIAALLLIFLTAYDAFGIASIFSVILAMRQIILLAFSRINLQVLMKIIRKTYAAEILFGMLLLIVAFSIVLPGLEPGIENFADGLWYCFAIVTTIGFGDITAATWIGRILSVILGLYGIIVVALITSIIVNFYNEVKTEDDPERKDAAGGGNGPETEKEELDSEGSL